MDNQHRNITGYRELSQVEIDAMNKIKALAEEARKLIEELQKTQEADKRWIAIGTTDLQTGFMALTRSIAKPTTF